MLRITSARPNIPFWDTSSSGDVVHAMPPTAGLGATSALRDAAALSQVLATEGHSAKGIGRHEESRRAYTGEAIRRSNMVGKVLSGMRPFEEMKAVAD